MEKTIGFIGGGRITKIFLQAFKNANFTTQSIVVSEPNSEIANSLFQQFSNIQITHDNKKAANCDYVFLSVHPPVIAGVLTEVSQSLKPESIVISLAPKFTIKKISDGLSGFNKIVRMIPNAPSFVNKGYNPVCFSDSILPKEKEELTKLFEIFGNIPEVQENKLEGYALLTGMGPTYFWFQFYELIELGKTFGFDEKEIHSAISAMIYGSVETIINSRLQAKEVMDLIPVKPIGEYENQIRQFYQTKLTEIYNKIKP